MKRPDLSHLKYFLINVKGLSIKEAEEHIAEVIRWENSSHKPKEEGIKPSFKEDRVKLTKRKGT